MSKQNGYVVFTATHEMAKQMPKVFKAGATYVAQQASAVAVGSSSTSTSGPPTRKATAKKESAKKKLAKKRASTKKATKVVKKASTKKATKRVAKKAAAAKAPAEPKATTRKAIKPDLILGYVKKHEGCNMTDIESHTKLPQPVIRRILNNARDAGEIRTEGQRRGLRYFYGSEAPVAASASADTSADNN
jgi:hypothetical protein